MYCHWRTALRAAAVGAAVVIPVRAPANAHAHHPATHAARHAARPSRSPAQGPARPLLAAREAEVGGAAGFAPTTPRGQQPSGIARQLALWVADADDNDDLPFMIVDKLAARVYAFDAAGDFLGSAPVLLGLARGDDSAPGIGGLRLSQISADERTTPAGRFVARFGRSAGHGTMLWVDFRDAISMHPVMSVSPNEHRLTRIRSADPKQHRISYGCINVPKTFYDGVVLTALAGGEAIVYVLPDTEPLADFFPAFAAAVHAGHEEGRRSRGVSRADLSSAAPDRIPEPSRLGRVDDRPWWAPPM